LTLAPWQSTHENPYISRNAGSTLSPKRDFKFDLPQRKSGSDVIPGKGIAGLRVRKAPRENPFFPALANRARIVRCARAVRCRTPPWPPDVGRIPGRLKMVERSRIRLLSGALASILLPGLSGCVWPPYEGSPLRGYPGHYYDYYYYPHEEVYYHIYTDRYYYRDGPVWWHSRRPPDYIRLDPGYRIWPGPLLRLLVLSSLACLFPHLFRHVFLPSPRPLAAGAAPAASYAPGLATPTSAEHTR
jgi:hypothetical protein